MYILMRGYLKSVIHPEKSVFEEHDNISRENNLEVMCPEKRMFRGFYICIF
jgi:hypothetical protein